MNEGGYRMTTKEFYKLGKWINKRLRILRRDEYSCQECKRYGKSEEASHVHHIIPLDWCLVFDLIKAMDNKNLISLCKKCHDKMHDRTNDKLTKLGVELAIRVLGDYAIDWNNKYNK